MLNLDVDLEIHTDEPTTIRELEPGQHFVSVAQLRSKGGDHFHHIIRRRTEDPFRSVTYLGTKIVTFPSERVFKVTVIERAAH